MKTTTIILLISISILACNQKRQEKAGLEQEYIENLEEKNRILERELRELKEGKEFNINDEPTKAAGTTQSKRVGTKAPSTSSSSENLGYFTIGSTENEVLAVMGDPTSMSDYGNGDKRFSYGSSSVDFENGRVKSYHNYGKNCS